jgi:AcrR family transcriptional regulator
MARPRSDIQERVVQAARARFLAEGVDGASLRTIARDAGTNVGMVFYYFPTKDDLFLAVVEEVYAKLLADLGAALGGAGTVRDRLVRVFVRLGEGSDDELEVIRLVAREALLSSERFRRIFARAQRGHVKMLLDALTAAVARGEIDPAVPPPLLLLSTMAMGALPQLVRRAAGREAPFSALPAPRALAEASIELLLRAFGTGPPDQRVPHRAMTAAPARPNSAREGRPKTTRARASSPARPGRRRTPR